MPLAEVDRKVVPLAEVEVDVVHAEVDRQLVRSAHRDDKHRHRNASLSKGH